MEFNSCDEKMVYVSIVIERFSAHAHAHPSIQCV